MLKPSTIPDTVHTYIQERLKALAKQHNIRILLAIESGSRAWGFSSQNSDYDVRFIYVRDLEDYLSVEAFRDVIETPLINDLKLGVPFDLNGWDVKKSLQVAIKSNAVLLE
jgi:predicted nucleotidyltransferase